MTKSFSEAFKIDAEKKYLEDKAEAEMQDKIYNLVCAEVEQNSATIKWKQLGEMPYVSINAAYANGFIEVEAETLNEAITFCERMNPEPLYRVKETFLYFSPEPFIRERDKEYMEIICPYILKVEGLRGYQEEKTLSFWIERNDLIIEVRVLIKNDEGHYRRSYRVVDVKGGYRVENVTIDISEGTFMRSDRFYSTHEHPNTFVLSA